MNLMQHEYHGIWYTHTVTTDYILNGYYRELLIIPPTHEPSSSVRKAERSFHTCPQHTVQFHSSQLPPVFGHWTCAGRGASRWCWGSREQTETGDCKAAELVMEGEGGATVGAHLNQCTSALLHLFHVLGCQVEGSSEHSYLVEQWALQPGWPGQTTGRNLMVDMDFVQALEFSSLPRSYLSFPYSVSKG